MTPAGHAAWARVVEPCSSYRRVVPCDYCGVEFDPIATRWLCPHCHMKANCCDGAPLDLCGTTRVPVPDE
jgi:hypothetical protein